ncbi:leucine-rich repeat-containing protein 51-like [Cololabis saira]|uniref:leucine-rich repeat-containing protein 51-like n=1 Tax=Cololabis saira TaxID=129043 RepID=UPI002AD2E9E9|nr:leucine-rich repeat-containing protein 51-like [Cololabis saira]
MDSPPVDLSFKEIFTVTDALEEEPNKGLRPLTTNSEGKYLSRSLRLGYNKLSNLDGLQYVIDHFLADPTKLCWLDLSFNNLTSIDPVLFELEELRVLYLHGNSISNMTEVEDLGVLKHLHTITLHGNVIESLRDYRNQVIFALPHLKNMDFSVVTPRERELANLWSKKV